jgi:hypothetical protein
VWRSQQAVTRSALACAHVLLQQAGKSKKNDGPCLTTSAMLCPADPSQSSAVGESKDGCGFLVAAQAFDQILLLVG